MLISASLVPLTVLRQNILPEETSLSKSFSVNIFISLPYSMYVSGESVARVMLSDGGMSVQYSARAPFMATVCMNVSSGPKALTKYLVKLLSLS